MNLSSIIFTNNASTDIQKECDRIVYKPEKKQLEDQKNVVELTKGDVKDFVQGVRLSVSQLIALF